MNKLASLLAATALAGCTTFPWHPGSPPPAPSPIPAPKPPPPPPPPGPAVALIHWGQIFDALIKNPNDMTGKVEFLWADNANLGAASGVLVGEYTPGYRSTYGRDLSWFYASHPDWVEYVADKKTPAFEFGDSRFVPFDISNPAAVSWKETEIEANRHGQLWVSVDNISGEGVNEVGHYAKTVAPCLAADQPACHGVWVQQYTGSPNDTKWIADNLTYLSGLHRYFAAEGRPVMINNAGNTNPEYLDPRVHIDLASQVDGSASEGWPQDACAADSGWVGGKPSELEFDATYQEASTESLHTFFAMGYLCNHELSAITQGEAAWNTAAYLLAVQNPAVNYLAVVGIGTGLTAYETVQNYPAYMNPPIGPITEAPPASGSRPYVRRFAHGVVALNPTNTGNETFVAPAGKDQFGNSIPAGTYTLKPLSAVVIVTP